MTVPDPLPDLTDMPLAELLDGDQVLDCAIRRLLHEDGDPQQYAAFNSAARRSGDTLPDLSAEAESTFRRMSGEPPRDARERLSWAIDDHAVSVMAAMMHGPAGHQTEQAKAALLAAIDAYVAGRDAAALLPEVGPTGSNVGVGDAAGQETPDGP